MDIGIVILALIAIVTMYYAILVENLKRILISKLIKKFLLFYMRKI